MSGLKYLTGVGRSPVSTSPASWNKASDRRALRIRASLEQPVADHPQGVRDHRYPQAVLLDVLRIGVVHQAPPPDELHRARYGEKMAHRIASRARTSGLPGRLPSERVRRLASSRHLAPGHHRRMGRGDDEPCALDGRLSGHPDPSRRRSLAAGVSLGGQQRRDTPLHQYLERIPEPQRPQIGPPLAGADPEPVAPPAASRSGAVTRIPFTPGSPILVSASIGGAGPVTLILDTGADRTMVSPGALGRLGIAFADGQPRPDQGRDGHDSGQHRAGGFGRGGRGQGGAAPHHRARCRSQRPTACSGATFSSISR